MRNNSRNLSHKNKGCSSSGSIVSIFVPLLLLLVTTIVLNFVWWNRVNVKVLAVNAMHSNLDNIKFSNRKIVIDSKEFALPAKGEQLGSIKIPSIGLDFPIFIGDSDEELVKGCGMDLRMMYPGEGGHVVLAGHTNLAFKNLGEVKIGDGIILDTSYAIFNYKAASDEIVKATDTTVIVPKDTEFLTIYTCYPFNFLASTDRRYVLKCDFINKEDKLELKVE